MPRSHSHLDAHAQNEWGLNSKAAPKIILGNPCKLLLIAIYILHIAMESWPKGKPSRARRAKRSS